VHPKLRILLVGSLASAIAASALSAGCSSDEAAKPASVPSAPTVSTHNRVKFKGGKRYVADLASALALEPKQLCLELSSYECEQINRIPLGGIEPYRLGVVQPLPERTVASSNAIDRIALSGCEQRAARDFAEPASATLFGELASGNVTLAAKQVVARKLYTRILQREPTAVELEGVLALYTEMEVAEGTKTPRSFATYACYAVATLEEAVFF
jgi:hypothetical protein